jgi:hypothetical protein
MDRRALILEDGTTRQIPDADTLLVGEGIDAPSLGALTIGGVNATSVIVGAGIAFDGAGHRITNLLDPTGPGTQEAATAAWVTSQIAGGGGDVNGPASATSSAIALYDGITGKVIKNSTVTVDGSGNVAGGTYNGVTVAAHAARHAPGGPDALGTAAPTTGVGAGNAEGDALTFARSDHNHALRTDSTDLTIGSIAIGQYLKRVGTTIVGAAAAGAARTLTGNFVGTLDTPLVANARWYPPDDVTVIRAWASLGEDSAGVTEFDVLRNGVSLLPSAISVAAAAYRSADVAVPSVAVTTTDYLTISLTTANGGANAVVFVEYV